MIENYAISIFLSGDIGLIMAIIIGTHILGFLAALRLLRNSTRSMRRVHYFMATSFITLLSSLADLGWLTSVDAMVGGYMGLLSIAILSGLFLLGAAYGVASHARSVNAFGDGGSAWMGFVPIANLYLMFKVPAEKVQKPGVMPVLLNILGVIAGLFMFASSKAISNESERLMEQEITRLETIPDADILYTKAMIGTRGLTYTLREMATGVQPMQIDKVTRLDGVVADGKTLQYQYTLDVDVSNDVMARLRQNTIRDNCSDAAIGHLIRSGATIRHEYSNKNGYGVGSIVVSRANCGNQTDFQEESAGINKNHVAAFSVEQVEELIFYSPARDMYRALQTYFPEEAQHMREELRRVVAQTGSPREAKSEMMVVGADIRKRHAHSLRTAPDHLLKQILYAQLDIVRNFEDDPYLCNRVIMNGAAAIPDEREEDVLSLFQMGVIPLFKGMYEGENSPVARREPTDVDWARFFNLVQAFGATDEELDVISYPERNSRNPKLCSGMIKVLRAATSADFENADRLRAVMAANMNLG